MKYTIYLRKTVTTTLMVFCLSMVYGQTMVKDIRTPYGSDPYSFHAANGWVYFAADDGVNGTELWKSDGTADSTVMVKDINPSGGSNVNNFITVNGITLFTAYNSSYGSELWKTDGTPSGTQVVKDINSGTSGSNPRYLTLGNGVVYFQAQDASGGPELWKTDGTASGTVRIKDIQSGSSGSYPQYLVFHKGILYFRATSSSYGAEVWRSDGTDTGTRVMADLYPGTSGSNPGNLHSNGSDIYFTATHPTQGEELWKSDGTAAGTGVVKDILPGIQGSSIDEIYSVGSQVFFIAYDGTTVGSELWTSDGTSSGTHLVKNIAPGGYDGIEPEDVVAFKNLLFFDANDGTHGTELWRSDGTSSGTYMLKDIDTNSSSSPREFFVLGDTLYFQAEGPNQGSELWKTDGTAAGTELVKDINPGSGASSPAELTNLDGVIFFNAYSTGYGTELWKYDPNPCDATYDTISVSECDFYVSPGGNYFWSSGVYNDTIQNVGGCDSVITIDLTILWSTEEYLTEYVFDSLVSPSGRHVWKSTGTYSDTLYGANNAGCDSIIYTTVLVTDRIFVDPSVSTGDGQSWGNAFSSLDDALNYANSKDDIVEIWLKKGIYYPGGQSHYNRDTAFVITNPYVRLVGGFVGWEEDISQSDPELHPTTLCGDIGKMNDSTDNSYHVLVLLYEEILTGLDFFGSYYDDMVFYGINIERANADGNTKFNYRGYNAYQGEGGGVVMLGGSDAEGVPLFEWCNIRNNYADYGSALFSKIYDGEAFPEFQNTTVSNNNALYGTTFLDASFSDASIYLLNTVFDHNVSKTSGGAVYTYTYGGGEAYVYAYNCVFNENYARSHGGALYNNGYTGAAYAEAWNCTFHENNAGTSGGAIYNFGSSGTSETASLNSLFYNNRCNGNADYKFSEFYNYQATNHAIASSLQRANSTYGTSTLNSLGDNTYNVYQTNPKFVDGTNPKGDDGFWRTGDDGLRLSSSSSLIDLGYVNGGTDILRNQQKNIRDMGAYEFVDCGLGVKLASDAKVHTAAYAVEDDGFICYCNDSNELLLALDTFGSGAVIQPSQVKLYIGNPSTISYNTSGGMISNPDGGVILERRWDVDPSVQPHSPVEVMYFYTNNEYLDVVSALANLSKPTTISSPSDLQFYKVKGGSSATFPNPHDTGVYGIVLTNGLAPDTNVWVNDIHGLQDHIARYLVTSFSGGGGGGGAGSAPLPVELLTFDAHLRQEAQVVDLEWVTASEMNNAFFTVERSIDGIVWDPIRTVAGAGTSQTMNDYTYHDYHPYIGVSFYRLKQTDFDESFEYSGVRMIDNSMMSASNIRIYPNPTRDNITIQLGSEVESETQSIKIINSLGVVVSEQQFSGLTGLVSLEDLASGLYILKLHSGETFKILKE